MRELKMVVRHQDLVEIAAAIKDYIEKAANKGEQISELLDPRHLRRGFSVPASLREVVACQGWRRGVGERMIAEREREVSYSGDCGSPATNSVVGGQRVSSEVNKGEEERFGGEG
ncbi:hypothetical protein Sjap_020170 [Stephania japonica]|uniref:Uncharacterized protein n=1 Tax=Stephania japonica TaxID=461633 RepID=A0AAP0I016_9MAGN